MKTTIQLIILLACCCQMLMAQHAGTGISFASGEFITVPDNTDGSLDPNLGFTIEAWVKADEVISDQKIFNKIEWTFDNGYILGIGNGMVKYELYDDEGIQYEINTGSIQPGEWTHIAGTYQPSEKMRLYLNGELISEIDASTGDHSYNTNDLVIGSDSWYTFLHPFAGELDEIRYWRKELDQQTIKDWMLKYVDDTHPDYSSLTLYHKYDEGSGTAANDTSPFANHGTFSGGAWVTSTAPFAGDHFAAEFDLDYTGIWPGYTNTSSYFMTMDNPAMTVGQSIVVGRMPDPLFSALPPGIPSVVSTAWHATTQGSPETAFVFDLTVFDWMSFSDAVLLIGDHPTNYSNAQVITGQFTNGSLTIPSTSIPDDSYLTIGLYLVTSVETVEDNGNEIVVMPNPSNGQFNLEWHNDSVDPAQVKVSDITGKLIYAKEITPEMNHNINLQGAPAGVYLLQVFTNDRIVTRKIMIN